MLADDLWADSLAQAVPDRLAERARALRPLAVRFRVLRAGHGTPVGELVPIDDRDGPMLLAELALGVIGADATRAAADGARDLEGHAAEAAGRAPYEDDVAGLDHV